MTLRNSFKSSALLFLLITIFFENLPKLFSSHRRTFCVRIFQSGAKMNSNLNLEIQMRRKSHLNKFLKKPIIVEADQYSEFTSRAMVDSLTKTFDRAMLDSDINAEISKSKRFGTIFSVLFIDLDNLKNINDTWGHESGTNAIKLVVECIRKRIRKYDSIYRYGGDEFIVKLPGTALLQAYNSAQRILNLVNESGNRNFPFTPTVSIGISSFDNQTIKSGDELLNFADRALYQAKQEGRNTIRAYGYTQFPQVNPLPHQAGLR